jgi:hypothetical protein
MNTKTALLYSAWCAVATKISLGLYEYNNLVINRLSSTLSTECTLSNHEVSVTAVRNQILVCCLLVIR